MVSGTGIRPFARLLDKSKASVWVISPGGKLVYLSPGCNQWLGFDSALLLDRRSCCGCANLEREIGFDRRCAGCTSRVDAPRYCISDESPRQALERQRPEAREVRFIQVGNGNTALVLAIAGDFDDRLPDPELKDAVAIRQQLDSWRRRHAATAINYRRWHFEASCPPEASYPCCGVHPNRCRPVWTTWFRW